MNSKKQKKLLWIYGGHLSENLSRATYLETPHFLERFGWRTTLIAADIPKEEKLTSSIFIKVVRKPRVFALGYLYFQFSTLVWTITHKNEFDLIIMNQTTALILIPLIRLIRFFGTKTPLLVLDTRSIEMETNTLKGKLRGIILMIAHFIANYLADGQTAITDEIVQVAKINKKNLMGIWPSGVNLDDFMHGYSDRIWPSEGSPVKFIYIGAIAQERNLLTFCKAITCVREEGYAAEFSILGEGPGTEELSNYIIKNRISYIKILPVVKRSEVPNVLKNYHIGVLPFPNLKIFQVSSPVKLFEYMASGLPILATRIHCHTSVLDGHNVFWAEDGSIESITSAIMHVFKNTEQLSKYGIEMTNEVERWSWESASKKLNDSLARLLSMEAN